jgi:hypothetical protein
MPSTKRAKIRNKVVPLEKATQGSRWWLDSDFGKSSSSKDTIEDLESFSYETVRSPVFEGMTHDFGTGIEFIYLKVKEIINGTVSLSFDGTDNTVIRLEVNEGFAARLDTTASIRVVMSGEAEFEYLTGI